MDSEDDGVTIEYEDETVEITPKSNYLDKVVTKFFAVLGSHGWIILGTLVILIYVWNQYIKPYIVLWLRNMREKKEDAQHHKNPDLLNKEKEKLENARLKLQQKYEEEAQTFKEKMIEKERLKREKQENALKENGVRLGDGNDDESGKKPHKPVYNPLMGASSLPSYRPPRRTACSRGSCG